ncbi:hypothetical protein COEREDRAFT_37099 [Coemansia reversa NRRL 1564]|uniref:Uncharacterized protein n=1 Tax=Coemansia reversa (strain ATCC 12441 / NRRL 1564) TaxID=763665 RepID=A0A2G5BKG6_COERN|nr:hypothetical protein COEREDRAFT_37099 [Coemansia reversa NRRL 1564]|eukprot:PIA19462.1 hypothetical protein COEREDRAFT_37099 [Coemansia reversa NRRL 1564]
MSQIAAYVNTTIEQAYLLNVKLQFGETLRNMINVLLDTKKRVENLKEEMKKAKKSRAEICKACFVEIWRPAQQIKDALRSRYIKQDQFSPKAQEVYAQLKPVWATYADPIKGNKGKGSKKRKKSSGDYKKAVNIVIWTRSLIMHLLRLTYIKMQKPIRRGI